MSPLVGAQLLAGLLLLVGGAEALVRGAVALARLARLSPLFIGLTVVAMGTSTPELAVSVRAALAGQADIAVGNVVGSSIANVLLILGAAALMAPLIVAAQLVWVDVPLAVAASALTWLLAADGYLGRLDGGLLAALLVGYVALALVLGRRSGSADLNAQYAGELRPAARPRRSSGRAAGTLLAGVLIIAGLALLVLGARLFVEGAAALARGLGVSEMVIGLTVVAVGTSTPELAASLVAAWRGHGDVAVGNIIGSNIFNLLGILGAAALLAPGGLAVSPAILHFDLPVMTATALACLPIFITGHRIARWEAVVFLAYYAAYVAYLMLRVRHHDALPLFSAAMLWFVLPLTGLTLAISLARALRPSGLATDEHR